MNLTRKNNNNKQRSFLALKEFCEQAYNIQTKIKKYVESPESNEGYDNDSNMYCLCNDFPMLSEVVQLLISPILVNENMDYIYTYSEMPMMYDALFEWYDSITSKMTTYTDLIEYLTVDKDDIIWQKYQVKFD